MKKTLFALMLVSNYLFGQQIDMKWGENGQIFAGGDRNNFVQLDIKALHGVESKFTPPSPIKLWSERNTKGLKEYVKTKHHLYFPLLDMSSDREKLYFQEIDTKGKLKGSYKLVSDDNYSMKRMMGPKDDYPNDCAGVVVSEDGEKLLRITSPGLLSSSVQQKFAITVLDESLNVIWAKVQDFPSYNDNDFALQDFILTKEGKVALSAIITNKPKNKKDNPTFSLKVFIISKANIIESDIPLSTDINPFLSKLKEGENGEVLVAGFYRNSKNIIEGNYNGSYIAGINLGNGEVTGPASYPFDEKIYGEHADKKRIDRGIQDAKITDLLKLAGHYFLIACYGGVLGGEVQVGGRGGPGVSVNSFDNIVAIGYSSDLKKLFESIVDLGFSTSLGNYSPRAFITGGKVLMLSNAGMHSPNNPKDYGINAVLMDESGKILSNEMLSLQSKGLEMDPNFARQVDDVSVILDICAFNPLSKRSDTDFKEGLLKVAPLPSTH